MEKGMWRFSLVLLLLTTGVFMWSALFFVLDVSLTQWHLLLTPILTVLLLKFITAKDKDPLSWGILIFAYLFFLAAVVGLSYVAQHYWAWTAAERGTQTEALIALSRGWNPLYDLAGDLSPEALGSAKGLIVLQSVLYLLTGHYEMTQVWNMWFMILLALASPYFFRKLRPTASGIGSFLMMFVLILNPVLLAQIWTGCLDGSFACAVQLLVMIGAMALLPEGENQRRLLWLAFSFLLIFTVNMTTWSLFTIGALLVPLLVWQIFKVENKKRGLLSALGLLLTLVVALALFGMDPFMKNIYLHHNILYPLDWRSLQAYAPPFIEGLNPLQQFWYALLARPTSDVALASLPEPLYFFAMKDPLAYLHPDPRLRGFGILSPILFLGMLVLLVTFFLPSKEKRKERPLWTLLVLQLVGMVLLTPGSWWARVIGFAWLLLVLLVFDADQRGFLRRLLGILMILFMLVNSAHYMVQAWPNQWEYADSIEGYVSHLQSNAIPGDAYAQRANADLKVAPEWMALKRKGEADITDQALLPKAEEKAETFLEDKGLWKMQRNLIQPS